MIRKGEGYKNFFIDRDSFPNIERYIREGLSLKEAVRKEILNYFTEEDLPNHGMILGYCKFFENIKF